MTKEFREKVRTAILIDKQDNYPDISDAKYAKMIGLNKSLYNRMKNHGDTEKIANKVFWVEQGRRLQVNPRSKDWKVAKTTVYQQLEETILISKKHHRATILTDDCGIGKTFCTKHILRGLENAFYLDCSQARRSTVFIRTLAKTLGLDGTGKLSDVKANIKYYLKLIDDPIIALDDSGYLDSSVFVDVIELWNGTEGYCGWLMIGDDSLQFKIQKGIENKKPGYKALFSRFSEQCDSYVPVNMNDKHEFYQQLIGDVAYVNVQDVSKVSKYVNNCIGRINKINERKSLRHLETLIDLDR